MRVRDEFFGVVDGLLRFILTSGVEPLSVLASLWYKHFWS